jgi:hypothetical protein
MAFASNPCRVLTSIKTGVEAYGLFIQLGCLTSKTYKQSSVSRIVRLMSYLILLWSHILDLTTDESKADWISWV